jgi:uncharacterized protein (DUF433 family)
MTNVERCHDSTAHPGQTSGRHSTLHADPEHAFGRPVIEGTNIATETLHAYVKSGEPAATVAEFFELNVQQVEEAVEFETRLAA